jgi:hypothetical protein
MEKTKVEEKTMISDNSKMMECIQACTHSHRACTEAQMSCLANGNCDAEMMRTMMDCAQMCQTSTDFMLRNSDLSGSVCGVCAEVCARCAALCENMAKGDDSMMECAQACRYSAMTCRQMAKTIAAH